MLAHLNNNLILIVRLFLFKSLQHASNDLLQEFKLIANGTEIQRLNLEED